MKLKNNARIGLILMNLRTVIALVVISLVFTILLNVKGINFLSPFNLITMSKHVALTSMMAIGMTFVIITGGIDLSIGSIVGFCGMIAGGLINEGLVLNPLGITIYFRISVIIIICLILGTGIGAVNGIVITRFNVAPFIGTLGTMYIARGFANLRSGGATFPNLQGSEELKTTGFEILGSGRFLAIPLAIWLMILIALVTLYVARKTPLGRHIYAIGGNPRAAGLSGIRVNMTKIVVYSFSGFCSALVGLIIASQLLAAHPATGRTFELDAIAAAVLGGTSMSGGIGTVGGTITGAFVIGFLGDGLVMLGVSEFWQNVIKGVVIILAVIFDQAQQKMRARAAVAEDSREAEAA